MSFAVGRSFFVRGLWLGCWGLASLVTVSWWWAAPADWGPWLGTAALLISGGCALWAWRRSPVGVLQWDGQSWQWQSDDHFGPCEVDWPEPVLDFQNVLLVRMHHRADAPRWVWADATSDPLHWLDLRRALYARPHHAGMIAR